MTSSEQSSLLSTVSRVVSVCDQLAIVYMLYGGSLLGSYRHHDMIPWDDDVDIVVAATDQFRLQDALADLQPEYQTYQYAGRIKIWSSAGSRRRYETARWQWPYIDVFFYDENATHVWDVSAEFRSYVYPKSMIFPTHLRPFAGLWLPAPRDTLAYLVATYPRKRHCSTAFYSHRAEGIMRSVSMRCQQLKNVYPFVHRRAASVIAVPVGHRQRVVLSPGVVEVLMLGDLVLHTTYVEEPTYTVDADPYVLPTRRQLTWLLTADTG